MHEIITVQNVRGRFNENGYAEINLEDAARGLGFTETGKSGNIAVRWRTVKKYLSDFGIATCCDGSGREGLPEFIAENIFYKLAFRASNETARKFQDVVTDEVLPSIRKHGIYATPSAAADLLSNPRKLAELLIQFADTQDKLTAAEAENAELKVIADKYEGNTDTAGLFEPGQIAKEYDISAQQLNRYLHEWRVIFKPCGSKTWQLYKQYADGNFAVTKLVNCNGHDVPHLFWTVKGKDLIADLFSERLGWE